MEVTPNVERELIHDAARALDIYEPGQPDSRMLALVLRTVAGKRRRRASFEDGGALPKRSGREWEHKVVEHAQARGFNRWDVGPLRGRRDLLDLTGVIPYGWLIGAKGVSHGVSAGVKLADSMDQNGRAVANLAESKHEPANVFPVQVIQRPRAGVGDAYAVMTYDDFLSLAAYRDRLENDLAALKKEKEKKNAE